MAVTKKSSGDPIKGAVKKSKQTKLLDTVYSVSACIDSENVFREYGIYI